MILFAILFLAVLGGLHAYVWSRLVREPAWPAPWSRVLRVAFFVPTAALGVSIALQIARAPRALASPVMWVAYSWLGVLFLVFVALVLAELGRAAVRLREGEATPERRRFLSRAFAAAVGAGGLGASAVAAVEGQRLTVKRVDVALPKFPARLSGYTIVQLSDVHIGPTLGRAFIDTIVARTNALEPDLIAITGDLVDGSVEDLGAFVEGLRGLRAKDGVFFVTGNHDFYSGADAWVRFLATLGVRALRNERVAIGGPSPDEGFDLAGVEDPQSQRYDPSRRMDVAAALAGRDPARAVVLLAHQPKAIVEAAREGVDLQLSGHTHGGQIFPFRYFVRLDQPYVSGLNWHERTAIYVSQGTGYWGPPMRLGAPAEITQLVLRRG